MRPRSKISMFVFIGALLKKKEREKKTTFFHERQQHIWTESVCLDSATH